MKTLYLDCFAGISGDMFVGSLIDLGANLEHLRASLSTLPLDNWDIVVSKTRKHSLAGSSFQVVIPNEETHHRHLEDILKLIEQSQLSPFIKQKGAAIFNRLATAEAKIHGTSPDHIHFHEVGAIDSIIDILAALCCLEQLQVGEIICSPLPLGKGFVRCAHGVLPLPAPATLELLQGVPIYEADTKGETVTPTGAVLTVSLANTFGPLPDMIIESIGYGAGQRDSELPNMLRTVIGTRTSSSSADATFSNDRVTVITCTIDDMNPEIYGELFHQLFTAGALDVTLTPVYMKKNRPGQEVTVLCYKNQLNVLAQTLLRNTTSLGLRFREEARLKLDRHFVDIKTSLGNAKVKLGKLPSTQEIINVAPEWDDCLQLADLGNLPPKTVYDIVKAEAILQFISINNNPRT